MKPVKIRYKVDSLGNFISKPFINGSELIRITLLKDALLMLVVELGTGKIIHIQNGDSIMQLKTMSRKYLAENNLVFTSVRKKVSV